MIPSWFVLLVHTFSSVVRGCSNRRSWDLADGQLSPKVRLFRLQWSQSVVLVESKRRCIVGKLRPYRKRRRRSLVASRRRKAAAQSAGETSKTKKTSKRCERCERFASWRAFRGTGASQAASVSRLQAFRDCEHFATDEAFRAPKRTVSMAGFAVKAAEPLALEGLRAHCRSRARSSTNETHRSSQTRVRGRVSRPCLLAQIVARAARLNAQPQTAGQCAS
jgi:hypothetical protein